MTAVEQKARKVFVAQSLAHARALPMRDAELFLKGLLFVTGEQEALYPLTHAHDELRALNDHMEQLQGTLDLK